MNKVPCTRCGVAILEATARKNGGLCVPCRTGKRESLEAAKRWHAEQRERERTDPFLKLWRQLVHRVHETPEGVDGLSDPEKLYFAVGLLDGEVNNGGFDQFFSNSSGSHYKYAERGLEAVGAMHSRVLLQRAKQVLFDFDDVPENTEKRRRRLRQGDSESRARRLDELDKQYWKDPDGLAERIEAFAREHGLV